MADGPSADELPWNGSDGHVLSSRAERRIKEFLTDTPELVNPRHNLDVSEDFVLGDGVELTLELESIGSLNTDRRFYGVNLELFVDYEVQTEQQFLHDWNDWGATLSDDVFSLLRDIYVGDGDYGPGSDEELYMMGPTNDSPSWWIGSIRVAEEDFLPEHETVSVELSTVDTTELNVPADVLEEAQTSDDPDATIEEYVRDEWLSNFDRGELLEALGFKIGLTNYGDDEEPYPMVTVLDAN